MIKNFLLQIRGAGQIGRPGSQGLPGPKVGKVCIHAQLLAMHCIKYKKKTIHVFLGNLDQAIVLKVS